jgi:hypothetical protein
MITPPIWEFLPFYPSALFGLENQMGVKMRNRLTILGVLSLVALAACQTLPPGASAFTAEEIRDSLAGRTWLWTGGSGGGVYFAPDGSARVLWEGEYHDTTWSTENGRFCHSERFCWSYYEKDGETWSGSLFQDEFREPYRFNVERDMLAGNRLP